MFTAERVDAARCEALGIVNRVVPAADLDAEALAFATRIANGPRAALAAIKDNLDEALTVDFLSALDGEAPRMIKAFQSADHKEAARAFVEKREPKFTGG
jgi:enoyl-CoA hydratase/carnithine racemase